MAAQFEDMPERYHVETFLWIFFIIQGLMMMLLLMIHKNGDNYDYDGGGCHG